MQPYVAAYGSFSILGPGWLVAVLSVLLGLTALGCTQSGTTAVASQRFSGQIFKLR
jgi:hypothetical protein